MRNTKKKELINQEKYRKYLEFDYAGDKKKDFVKYYLSKAQKPIHA